MTASLRESLALSSPATSSHFTFGFSSKIALPRELFILSSSSCSNRNGGRDGRVEAA